MRQYIQADKMHLKKQNKKDIQVDFTEMATYNKQESSDPTLF